MLRRVQIDSPGDTNFILNQQVDKHKFKTENDRVVKGGGKAAVARPLLLGIAKASLAIDSFISAVSFQKTVQGLTDAAIEGKNDELRGLKENIIIGRMIPAGTGMKKYKDVVINKAVKEEISDIVYEEIAE